MNYNSIITNLYYLLVYADGSVNEKEVMLGQQMISAEGIRESEFKSQFDAAAKKNSSSVFVEAVAGLRNLDRNRQMRVVAWLCVIANADGFMDRAEWQFIYRIYHKELNLPLDEIMKIQKELSRSFRDKVMPVSINVAA